MAINRMLVFHSIQISQVSSLKTLEAFRSKTCSLVNTPPPHPSFDMYNNNNSGFADSGYLSRTPTPPTPVRIPSPQPMSIRQDRDHKGKDSHSNEYSNDLELVEEIDTRFTDNASVESKPRLPYVKRTRIQYTLQQVSGVETKAKERFEFDLFSYKFSKKRFRIITILK